MKKIVYLVALVAISLLFVQCGQNSSSQGQGKHSGHEYVDSSTPLDTPILGLGKHKGHEYVDSSTPLDTPILGLGKHKGHEYVDLGLPSGLKWATCNVGATAPEEYGDYFAWGEVEPKDYYDWSTYKYCAGFYVTMTKYCHNSSYGKDGFTDSKTVLDPEDDAATVNWGGAWRMPTKEEQDELRNNCTWTWTTQNGVNGYKVTGPNGNSIFLPAAGYMLSNSLYGAGLDGNYWSSSFHLAILAYYVNFSSDFVAWDHNYRCNGRSVRPVCNGQNSSSQGQGKHPGHEYVDSSTPLEPIFVDLESSTPLDTPILELGNKHKGHEYVDLGLPSGLKWATCNVGATAPEEYGDYFAWGEVESKDDYSWETYKYCNGSYNTLTKYNTKSKYGRVDYKTTLDAQDDAAIANWGGAWRMPTKEEQEELVNNCTWTRTTENGVYGCKVTGPNGNSIFLPAAGYMIDTGYMYGSSLYKAGRCGLYWSSSLITDNPGRAYDVYFDREYLGWGIYYRGCGLTVRPVCK